MSTASSSSISTPFLSEEPTPPRTQDWKREISHLVESRRERRTNAVQPSADPAIVSRSQTSTQERAARAAKIAATVAARYAAAPTYTELWQQQKSGGASTSASLLEAEKPQEAISEAGTRAMLAADAIGNDADNIHGELPFDAAPPSPATEMAPAPEDLFASAWITPPIPLPANLIEFPRERVAPRRARPKLAEGPMGAQAQLRIFEVDPETMAQQEAASTIPSELPAESAPADVAAVSDVADACASICLGAQPEATGQEEADAYEALPLSLPTASLHRRLMALVVDFCLVTCAFLSFLFVFAVSTPHLPAGKSAVVMGGIVYFALWLLYQFLFFSLSHATAGMYYARIALCTFDDENPRRNALRRRIVAWWVSALPLGLGFAWALLDEDGLSWHDRMTRTYPRSY